jgi:hypothetical protein
MANEHRGGLTRVAKEIRKEAARQLRGFPRQVKHQMTGFGREAAHQLGRRLGRGVRPATIRDSEKPSPREVRGKGDTAAGDRESPVVRGVLADFRRYRV